MAEQDYQRLRAACGCGGLLPAYKGRGAPPKYCGDKCRPNYNARYYKSVPLNRVACADCGVEVETKSSGLKRCRPCQKKRSARTRITPAARNCAFCCSPYTPLINAGKYCSAQCRISAGNEKAKDSGKKRVRYSKSGLTRDAYALLVRNPSHWFTCELCGRDSHRTKSSRMAKLGTGNRWCSMACRVEHGKQQRLQKQAQAERIRAIKAVACALLKAAKAKEEQDRPPPTFACTCIQCNKTFPANRRGVKLCGIECSKRRTRSLPSTKANKRAWRIARKAKERAATVETFDPFEVFERDGWRCQICGIATPKKLRGTYKPNAPELDHIVALSKGGEHSRANTQCACRQCNGLKSDGSPRGQIGLFAAEEAPRWGGGAGIQNLSPF